MPKYPTDIDALIRDCDLSFVRDSGPGGQHRNKRETGVRLVHRETGLVVMATERRSQTMNRTLAFERMAAEAEAAGITNWCIAQTGLEDVFHAIIERYSELPGGAH